MALRTTLRESHLSQSLLILRVGNNPVEGGTILLTGLVFHQFSAGGLRPVCHLYMREL